MLLQNRMLAESLFKVFDDDNSGTFSFEEYYQVFRLITIIHLRKSERIVIYRK